MCRAAVSHKKLESLVSLFSDIGFLCSELKLRENARNHLLLCKYVREEQGWSIPRSIETALSNLDNEGSEQSSSTNLKDSLTACRAFWFRTIGVQDDPRAQPIRSKKIKQTLQGKLILGHSEKPFCFISSANGN
jgi:hypothetical protein